MRKFASSPLHLFILVTLTVVFTCNASSVLAANLDGTVQLGGTGRVQPQRNVRVKLYEATENQPTIIGQTRTNRAGHFTISTNQVHSDSIFFVTADIGYGVQFVTVLGPDLPLEITVNELTSVAASYSMAQFYRKGYISGSSFQLRIAAMMNNNIVDISNGQSSPVLLSSPNADQTHSLRMTRSLANLLNASARNFFVRLLYLWSTTPPGSSVPQNTAVATANLARDPGRDVFWLYLLSKLRNAYSPVLYQRPDAWTVTVKVTGQRVIRLARICLDCQQQRPGNTSFREVQHCTETGRNTR